MGVEHYQRERVFSCLELMVGSHSLAALSEVVYF